MSPGLLLTEWGMQFPEEKREGARMATKLKRLPTVEVGYCLTRAISCNGTDDDMTGLRRCGETDGAEPVDDGAEYDHGLWHICLKPYLPLRSPQRRRTSADFSVKSIRSSAPPCPC